MIDKILEERFGYVKTDESNMGVRYEKKNTAFDYTHVVEIGRNVANNKLLFSYEKGVLHERAGFAFADSVAVGIEVEALPWFWLKYITKKLKIQED